jgi:hypothetical protein
MKDIENISPVNSVSTASGSVSTMDAIRLMVEKAMETTAQTVARAFKGDQEAMRKLAAEAAKGGATAQPPAQNAESELDVKA